MSANNNKTPSAIIGKPKKPAKRLASSSLIPVGETSFVAELAVVSRHEDIDHEMPDAPQPDVEDEDVVMVDAPVIEPVPELDSVEVAMTDPDTVMVDAPDLIEPVPELDSVEVAVTDPDTVMEDAPPLN